MRRVKRGLITAALCVLAAGATLIFLAPSFWPVLMANALMATVGDVFGPAVAALTLGLYRRAELARRIGRNAAFDHAGNVAIAVVAGVVGWTFSQRAVFLLVPAFAFLAAIAVWSIPDGAIDHRRARGGEPSEPSRRDAQDERARSGCSILVTCRPLLVYAGCTVLFHLANAPLLPLVGQKLALAHPALATAMMSSCIIAAQAIMLPIALVAGYSADRWGRKPILLIGFAILPLRGALYTLCDNSAWLIGVPLLDGVGAGIFGVMTSVLMANLMRGTGRYNLALGAIATAQGIGASSSGLAAGLIVDNFGYSAAFLAASFVAAIALLALAGLMPETRAGRPG